MSKHRLIVSSMLAVTTVLALQHLSTFPVAVQAGMEPAPQAPAEPVPPSRPIDAEALRSLA